MTNLKPIQLEDGEIIYIQAEENTANLPTFETSNQEIEKDKNSPKELDFLTDIPDNEDRVFGLEKLNMKQQGEQLQNTIKSYSKHIIKSFKDLALAEVTEVTLEFGVNIGGMAGIPYIATGNTDCNIKVTVKCEFNNKKSAKDKE